MDRPLGKRHAIHRRHTGVIVRDGATAPIRRWSGPREQMQDRGAGALSDRDLVAALLGSGGAGRGVRTLAAHVLAALERHDFQVTVRELCAIPGIGAAKAAQLAAALELGRRVVAPRNYRIRNPADVVPLLAHYADRPQEHFLTVTLNGAHEVITTRIVSIGLVNRTLVSSCGSRAFLPSALSDRSLHGCSPYSASDTRLHVQFSMTISQFASRCGLSVDTIRYYEKIGLLPTVTRSSGGHRVFCERDLDWVEFVLRLKDTDMPLSEIIEYAELREIGESTIDERIEILEQHRKRLSGRIDQLRTARRLLTDKIEHYDSLRHAITKRSP